MAMLRAPLAIMLLISAATSGCATGRGTAVSADELAAVAALERQRFAAVVRADVATLGPWLAADLSYCHSTGRCQTRQEFLDDIGSGALRYRSIEVLEMQPRAVGDTVVLNGRIALEVDLQGQPNRLILVYTDVYVRRDGRWQLAAWHSTRAPAGTINP
jgi:hypothetical protein